MTDNTPSTSNVSKDPEPERIAFLCTSCGLSEQCDYFGRQPPFARKIQFTEDCFVMKDPFSPPPSSQSNKTSSEYYLVLGANCIVCANTFCKGGECSIYYSKTFCLTCAKKKILDFPLEIQSKIRKQLAAV
jgi:Cysteine-rich domain